MSYQGTSSKNNEITKEASSGTTSNDDEITEEGTTSNNDEITKEGTTSNNNEITKEGATSNNGEITKEGATSNNGEITKEDRVRVFVAYNGEWEWNDKDWFFNDSKGSMMVVSKYVTLSKITDILCKKFDVDQDSYRLKLEVHYRVAPWFPIIEIECDEDLSLFISESSKTKLPLCVTAVLKDDDSEEVEPDEINPDIKEDSPQRESPQRREDDKVERRLMKAIRKGDLVKAQDIVNKEEVTWTSKLNDDGFTPLHFVVGRYKDNEVARDILRGINSELLATVKQRGMTLAHTAASVGNTEALKILLESNPKYLFIPDNYDLLAIHHAVSTPIMTPKKMKTFSYLLKQMKSNKAEYGILFSGKRGLSLLHQVIDTGLIDVAYELINDYPSLATTLYRDKTVLETIVRNSELFYSGTQTHYSSFARFVYHIISIENNSLSSTDTADVQNQKTPKKDKFVTKYMRRCLHDVISRICVKLWETTLLLVIPIKNNSLGSIDTADVENQETPKKDKFVTKHTRRCLHDVISRNCVKLWETMLHVISRICVKLLETTLLQVPHIKRLKDDKVKHNTTIKLLRLICEESNKIYTESDQLRLYTSPFFLAVENNTPEAIDVLTTYFPLLYYSPKNRLSVHQLTVLNRSEKVYSYILHHQDDAKYRISLSIDSYGSNILHLAGYLAPIHKLIATSGAALQMQRELQWFEELKRVVGIKHTRALNRNKQTPMMVFRKNHENLRKDGEEWMKKTAESYTITAALIITIVFAAAITVPGGNDNATGKPIYETKASLIIFAISDAISLFTSSTSLLLFLSILTARYADEDFLYKLPKRLIIGLVMLFVSVTSMMIAFSATLYIMFGQGKPWILFPIAALTCLPIASFVTLQFPLLVELISSTYGPGIFGMEKYYRQSSVDANKKKRT